MTERTKLRNQIHGGLFIGVWQLGHLVWNLVGRPHDTREWWIMNAAFVAWAGVGFGIAWTYWEQYREKYPRT